MSNNNKPPSYLFPPNSGKLECCPVCGSDATIRAHAVIFRADCLCLPAECNECKSTWHEVFILSLLENVNVSDQYKKREEIRAAYSRETLERAYEMYARGSTHYAVVQATGVDRQTAEWISSRQLAGLGLPPVTPVSIVPADGSGDEL